MINSNAKGGSGEREFCKWLKDELGIEAERKLGQARDEGADILVGPYVIEVKRCEVIQKRQWWLQVSNSEKGTRIVAYRKNRNPWRFLISAKHLGLSVGFLELEEFCFKAWMNLKMLDDRQ